MPGPFFNNILKIFQISEEFSDLLQIFCTLSKIRSLPKGNVVKDKAKNVNEKITLYYQIIILLLLN